MSKNIAIEEEMCLNAVCKYYRKKIMPKLNTTSPFTPQFQAVVGDDGHVESVKVYHSDNKTKANIPMMAIRMEFIRLIMPNATVQMIKQYEAKKEAVMLKIEDKFNEEPGPDQ